MDSDKGLGAISDDLCIEHKQLQKPRTQLMQGVSTTQGVHISLDEALHKIGEFGAFQLCTLSVIFLASGLCIPLRTMAPVYIHKTYHDFNCDADR